MFQAVSSVAKKICGKLSTETCYLDIIHTFMQWGAVSNVMSLHVFALWFNTKSKLGCAVFYHYSQSQFKWNNEHANEKTKQNRAWKKHKYDY